MKKVLIVDSSRLMRSMLKEFLFELGLDPVGEAVDVHEGIKAYNALKPDLITLDLLLPGRSGLDMMKEILSRDPKANILVITDSGQPDVEHQVAELGARGILHKPVTRDSLQKAIGGLGLGTPKGKPENGRLRALVVNDSLATRSLLKDIFSQFEVETVAEAGELFEAVSAYRSCAPDIVALDLALPEGSALKAVERILSHDPKAKIILLGSRAQDAAAEEALRMGACALLRKPLTPEPVQAALKNIFTSKEKSS